MKHLTITFAFLGFACTLAVAQDTIFEFAYTAPELFYFDDSANRAYFFIDTLQVNNVWQIGNPQKVEFDSALSQPFALITDTASAYPSGNVSSFEVLVTSDDATFIEFWQRYDTDTLQDGLVVEVSDDGGNTWVNMVNHPIVTHFNFPAAAPIAAAGNQMGFSGNSNGWNSSVIVNDEFCWFQRFRFTFYSDSIDTGKDGWMIDNFMVNCDGTGIEKLTWQQSLNVFPNPVESVVELDLDFSNSKYKVVIKDILGSELFSITHRRVDVSSLNSGVYLIEASDGKNRFVSKMIKR